MRGNRTTLRIAPRRSIARAAIPRGQSNRGTSPPRRTVGGVWASIEFAYGPLFARYGPRLNPRDERPAWTRGPGNLGILGGSRRRRRFGNDDPRSGCQACKVETSRGGNVKRRIAHVRGLVSV